MKKSKFKLLLLSSVLLLSGCGETKGSTTTSNSNSNTGGANSTEEPVDKIPDPTEALTEAMFADYKLGYSASYIATRSYAGESKVSSLKFDVESKTNKFKFSKASIADDGSFKKYGNTKWFWAVEEDGTLMAKDVSLKLDNTLFIEQVTEEDSITQQEFDLEWQYTYYENVFSYLSVSDFTKKDSNTFVLSDSKTKEYSDYLQNQLFSPYELYSASSDANYFALKTDGDSIVGFELTFATYTSSTATISYSCTGTFSGKGESAYEDVAPISGDDIPELQAILDELKCYNWELTQTQSQFDYSSEKMTPLGTLKVTVGDNGDKEYWEYYDTDNYITQSYGYMKYVDKDNHESKLGVVKLGDYYYQDNYLYSGTMSDKMPTFNLCTKFFKKDTAASVNGKVVYKLDSPVEISNLNVTTHLITPETMRSYDDQIIHLTITKDGDKITIRNSTSTAGDESTGLIMNCEYSNIGGVTNFMDETTMKDSVAGLKWSDLLSRNEKYYNSIAAAFGKDNLDTIPLVDDSHANIYIDYSSKSTTLYFTMYDEEELEELKTEYLAKLAAAGLVKSETSDDVYYLKDVTIQGDKGRKYTGDIEVTVTTWWNSIQSWGQFQVGLATQNLKSVSSK